MSRLKRIMSVGVGAAALLCALNSSTVFAETQQEHVHEMSHSVMPFSMAKTIHVFNMTEMGGIEQVLVRDDKDTDQVALIRQHLKHEAMRFQHGNYGDPAKLHGKNMLGIHELEANASEVHIRYSDIKNGGQITFETKSLKMLTAIHRWFGAQLSEHGADAKAE